MPLLTAEYLPLFDAGCEHRRVARHDPTDPLSDALVTRFTTINARRAKMTWNDEAPSIYVSAPGDSYWTVTRTSPFAQVSFPIPAGATPGGGSDDPMVVLCPYAHNTYGPQVLLRLWQVDITGATSLTCSNWCVNPYNSDGKRLLSSGTRISDGRSLLGAVDPPSNTGSGLCYTAGMILRAEVDRVLAGDLTAIRHAIRVSWPSDALASTHVRPAIASDQTGSGAEGDGTEFISMGRRFLLTGIDPFARTVPDPATGGNTVLPDSAPETRLARAIAWTLTEYGLILQDGTSTSSCVVIYMEDEVTAGWAADFITTGTNVFGGLAWTVRTSGDNTIYKRSTDGIPWKTAGNWRVVTPPGADAPRGRRMAAAGMRTRLVPVA